MTVRIRISRHVMTDEVYVQPYRMMDADETDVCSFCNQPALWIVGAGDVLYCIGCRLDEHQGGHAWWGNIAGVDGIEITEAEGTISAEVHVSR